MINEEHNLLDIYRYPDKYYEFLTISGYLIYRIRNSMNNKSYIGDTSITLMHRLFFNPFGAHFLNYDNGNNAHLYNSMRKYGLDKFFISILSVNSEDSEEKFIEIYDSFTSGYNRSKSGLSFNKGSAILGKIKILDESNNLRYIKPDELEYFESIGWRKESNLSHYSWMNDGEVSRMISNKEVDSYILKGWELGRLSVNVDTNWINKLGEIRGVRSDELTEYISNGWSAGRGVNTCKDRIWIHKLRSRLRVSISELDNYLKQGYSIGHGYNPMEDKSIVHKDGISKYINNSDLSTYLSNGWIKGRGSSSNKGRVKMNNGIKNFYIKKEEVSSLLDKDWKFGFILK